MTDEAPVVKEVPVQWVAPTWQWIAVSLLAVLMTVAGLLYAQTQGRIRDVEEKKASVESVVDLKERLKRIEDKQDRILEKLDIAPRGGR
jgi:cell division protein FtsX